MFVRRTKTSYSQFSVYRAYYYKRPLRNGIDRDGITQRNLELRHVFNPTRGKLKYECTVLTTARLALFNRVTKAPVP